MVVSWVVGVTAIVCDSEFSFEMPSNEIDEVTGAFMANALLTRRLPYYCFVLFSRECSDCRPIEAYLRITGLRWYCTSHDKLRSHMALNNSLNGSSQCS